MKYEDGFIGPRTREMMAQLVCMNGMTNAEKIDFLMSRNRELRAENEKLYELIRDMWRGMCGYGHDCYRCDHMRIVEDGTRMCKYKLRMNELGIKGD